MGRVAGSTSLALRVSNAALTRRVGLNEACRWPVTPQGQEMQNEISSKRCKKVPSFGVKNGKKPWFSGENEIAHTLQKVVICAANSQESPGKGCKMGRENDGS
jgi:hypothetical protein